MSGPSRPRSPKSGGGVLHATRQRRALALRAADDLLPARPATCGPRSRCASRSAARRGTQPPVIQLRSRRSSPACTQTWWSSSVGSSAWMLRVPSLNPNRLRGVVWVTLVLDVRPKPSCDHRSDTVPKPIRARLRTAWNADLGVVGAGLHAQVAPAAGGVEPVAGEVGESRERGRSARRESESVGAVGIGEQRRSEPERDRECARVEPERFTGVAPAGRGRPRRPRRRRWRRGPGSSAAAASVQAAEQPRQLVAVVGDHVERGEVQVVLGGGDDAGLVRPVERHGAAVRRTRPTSSEPPNRRTAAPTRAPARRRRTAAEQQAAAADAARRGRLDRGSQHDRRGQVGQRLAERVRRRRTSCLTSSAVSSS